LTSGEKTRALWEWIFFTGLVVTIGLAAVYLPVVYFPATVFLPVPVILQVLRKDIRYGISSLAMAGIILFILIPQPVAVFVLIIHYGFLGILYGLLFKNNVFSGGVIVVGLLGAVALALLSAGLSYAFTGSNPFALSMETRQAAEEWLTANRQAGTFNELPTEWQEIFDENIINIFELLIPGQYLVTSGLSSAATYFLARAFLRRGNFPLPPEPAFTRMSFPWYSIWGLIAGLGLALAGDQFSLQLATKLGKNILFIAFYAYLVLGLSVTVYFYRKIKFAPLIKVFLVFLALIYLPFSTMLVLLLGVTDPLVNFRRLPAGKG